MFQKQWAFAVLEQVLLRLRDEMAADGNPVFEALEEKLNGSRPSQNAVVAAELGTSEGAVKTAAHRLRRRYGLICATKSPKPYPRLTKSMTKSAS